MILTGNDGADLRFIVLDVKYRASRANVLDAMESAHIYQDSLRIGPSQSEASLLIIPSGGEAAWLEAPELHAEHRVGTHVMSPDGGKTIPQLCVELLQ